MANAFDAVVPRISLFKKRSRIGIEIGQTLHPFFVAGPKGIDRGLVEQELATLLPLKPDNPIAARLSTLFDKFPVD